MILNLIKCLVNIKINVLNILTKINSNFIKYIDIILYCKL